jgi:predicted metal-dependent phosphoesterase TrpH
MPDNHAFTCCVDLHVHTRRYSPCAEGLDPVRLVDCLAPTRLQGLVITEHDHLWASEDIAALNRSLTYGRIYRGVEVSSRNGHFIVIGLDRLPPPPPGISADDLIDYVRPSDAVVIWAHPYLMYDSTVAALSADRMPQAIDALEVASSITTGKHSRRAQALAIRRGWAAVGGSDAHTIGQVGAAYTLLTELPADEKALALAIRQGCCRAAHRHADTRSRRAECC